MKSISGWQGGAWRTWGEMEHRNGSNILQIIAEIPGYGEL